MKRPEFDTLFQSEVGQTLAALGFRHSGKSLHLFAHVTHVALIRLGGRFSTPGSAAWTLCFRHTFLRELTDLRVVTDANLATEHYPFKFTPSELMEHRSEMRYYSRLLRFDYDRFDYSGASTVNVQERLGRLTAFLRERFVPWAVSITPEAAREQIQHYGTGAWAEKIWIEDYDRFMQAHRAQQSAST
jgi:hypothetical protein